MKPSISRPRKSPSTRRPTFSTILGFIAVLVLIAVSLWSVTYHHPSTENAGAGGSSQTWNGISDDFTAMSVQSAAAEAASSGRTFYPYSVVAGGVRSAEELQRATQNDSVVARHYAGFDFRKARSVEVRQPKLVYVSYRRGEQVYWTSKKIALHLGERLITDGKITSRSRCGNQVSESAKQPVAAALEPSPKSLDQTFKVEAQSASSPFAGQFASLQAPVAPRLSSFGGSDSSGSPVAGGPGGTAGGMPAALFPVLASPCNPKAENCPSAPPKTPPGPPPVVPPGPPTQVPEPDSYLMIMIVSSAGALATAFRRLRR